MTRRSKKPPKRDVPEKIVQVALDLRDVRPLLLLLMGVRDSGHDEGPSLNAINHMIGRLEHVLEKEREPS